MLTIILAESALETIPRKIWEHPTIKKHAFKKGKKPAQILLDRSYHHKAMLELENNEKRGRPDIVHFCLLEALGSPLNKEGLLKVYVHTINDYIIEVNPSVRLPRNYNRFVGLMEQLFQKGQVPPKSQKPLLKIRKETLQELFKRIKPDYTIVFTRDGQPKTVEDAISSIRKREKPALIVGCFPRGKFSNNTLKLADERVCIDRETLEAWTVVSRIIYEYERVKGVTKLRIKNEKFRLLPSI